MPAKLLRLSAVTLLLLLPLVAACGDDDDSGGDSSSNTPIVNPSIAGPQTQPAPAQPLQSGFVEPTAGVMELSVADLQFVQNYIRVPEGESVVIRVTNNDTVLHDLRIAGIDGRFATEDDAVTTPEQIGPGEVGELTFAPPVPGAYTFQCDFHAASMGGQIVVGDATPGPTATPTPVPSVVESETPEATE